MPLPKHDAIGRRLPRHDDRAGWEALRERHFDELGRRKQWCLAHGLAPADEHAWKAPGDDTQFMFGVAPWDETGAVNPSGVPFVSLDWLDEQKREVGPQGWSCTVCERWVDVAPRPFTKGPEPVDWWWCYECRKTVKRPSQKEMKLKREVESMQKIDAMFLKKRKTQSTHFE